MDTRFLAEIGIGASFMLPALGSVIGAFVVGSATIGAWKKCYLENKPGPFIMVAFAGAPLTNAIYGFILMGQLTASARLTDFQLFFMGLFAGFILAASAYTQARVAAYASEAYAETGQGFGNYMMIIGVCETIALFTMVFTILIA